MRRAILLVFLIAYAACVKANFVKYPSCAQPILVSAFSQTGCNAGDATTLETEITDQCLCRDQGYLTDIARGVYTSCGCDVLKTVAQVNDNTCSHFQTDSALGVVDFINAGSPTCASGSQPLSAGVIAGIVLSAITIIVTIVLGIVQYLVSIDKLDEKYAPWPKAMKLFRTMCCCCCLPGKPMDAENAGNGENGGREMNQLVD